MYISSQYTVIHSLKKEHIMSTRLETLDSPQHSENTQRHTSGRPDPWRKRHWQGLRTARAWWFTLCLIGFASLWYIDPGRTSVPSSAPDPAVQQPAQQNIPGTEAFKINATIAAKRFVHDTLLTPKTASFPLWTEAIFRDTTRDDIFVVTGQVDSQNAFGAMLRQPYHVTMRFRCGYNIALGSVRECWEPQLVQVGRQYTQYQAAKR
jgi:hypothetical protein